MFSDYPTLLTVEDVCTLLSVERHAIYKLISEGEVNAIKPNSTDWRITKESLICYVLISSGINIEKEDIYDYL